MSLFILSSIQADEVTLSQYDNETQQALLDMVGRSDQEQVKPTPKNKKLDLSDYSKEMQAVLLNMAGENQAYLSVQRSEKSSIAIDYHKGIIHITGADQASFKKLITQTVLTQYDPGEIDPKTAAAFGLVSKNDKPFFYKQILDQDKKPINSQWRADRYAQYLLQHSTIDSTQQYVTHIQLTSNHTKIESVRYYNIVAAASRRYNIPISLIYGVIETESAFNPRARSGSNAIGLMQILRRQAGHEYFRVIKKRDTIPSERFLFNTHNNIEVGTAYLHIVGSRYLKGIRNETVRDYAIIASYNGGAGNLYKSMTWGGGKKAAIKKLNNMTPKEAYWFITNKHNRKETQNYLKRVTRNQQKYLHLDR